MRRGIEHYLSDTDTVATITNPDYGDNLINAVYSRELKPPPQVKVRTQTHILGYKPKPNEGFIGEIAKKYG